MTVDTMTIREMCDAFNVTPRTLRFYETKELLAPVREGQKRFFTKRDRGRLKLILRGKRFGFSLEEIRQLLNLYDADDQQHAQMTQTFTLGVERLRDMEDQREELDKTIKELRDQMTWLENVLTTSREGAKAAE